MTRSQSLSYASDAPSDGLTPASRPRRQSTRRTTRGKAGFDLPEPVLEPDFEREPQSAPAQSNHTQKAASPAQSGRLSGAAQPTVSHVSHQRSLLGRSLHSLSRHSGEDAVACEEQQEAETPREAEGGHRMLPDGWAPMHCVLPAGLLILLLGTLFLWPSPPVGITAADMLSLSTELAGMQQKVDSLQENLYGSQQWQDLRYEQLESEFMRESDKLRSAMVSAVAAIAGQQEQLKDTSNWAASAVKALQLEVQTATHQTQQHSRQQATLLAAQLQAAQSAASLAERMPAPPATGTGALEAHQEEKWRLAVATMLQGTLDTFEADRTGLTDYALASAGGRVVGHSKLAGPLPVWYRAWRVLAPAFAGPHPLLPHLDKLLLMPGAAPGQCLPLNGSVGFVDIKLREAVLLAAITLQHIPASIAFDVRSAPRQLRVIGYERAPLLPRLQPGSGSAVASDVGQHLADVTYDLDGTALQTFALHSTSAIKYIRVQVLSNHGHPDFTCLYRIRVHGSAYASTEGLLQSDVEAESQLPQ